MQKNELKRLIKPLPMRPGVYLFSDSLGKVLYVGKALSLHSRLTSYTQKTTAEKISQLVASAHTVRIIETGSEFEALLLEAALIKLHQPRYNSIFRDDKSYIYIYIPLTDQFPKIQLAHRPKNLSLTDRLSENYFGPYPSSSATKILLKKLRRIFPFCQQKQITKKPCFYHHLGLCNPCPSEIMMLEPEGNEFKQLKAAYRTNIFRLKRVLTGKYTGVEKELQKEMLTFAKNQDFENAAKVRNQLDLMRIYFTDTHKTSAFLSNPNFFLEGIKDQLADLKIILNQYGIKLQTLSVIECYDISTISGQFSVGSGIVLKDGVPFKAGYRRYKIRKEGIPNDVGMLEEMLARRLNHREWILPDLFVVDGGKGQLSRATELLKKRQVPTPIIGLAKRREQIVILTNQKFELVTLPPSQPARLLLQQIRDEAHRFAITYNRKLRRKSIFS